MSILGWRLVARRRMQRDSVRRDLDLRRARTRHGERRRSDEHARPRARSPRSPRARAEGRDGYRIGPDDLLDIRIPKLLTLAAPDTTHAANSGATRAVGRGGAGLPAGRARARRGDVTLPLIGSVHAAGRTPGELEAEIARRLVAGRHPAAPEVSVQIAEHRSSVVAVIGSVERPGLYPLTRPGATIADLIWAAGGPNKEAGRVVEFTPASGQDVPAPPIRIDLERAARRIAAASRPRSTPWRWPAT